MKKIKCTVVCVSNNDSLPEETDYNFSESFTGFCSNLDTVLSNTVTGYRYSSNNNANFCFYFDLMTGEARDNLVSFVKGFISCFAHMKDADLSKMSVECIKGSYE